MISQLPRIGQTISHYRIVENLGEGGMGSVFIAEDMNLGRRVAVKFPAAAEDEHQYHARFLREARAASRLSHPNIATIYDYGETEDGRPFIVMEYVEGSTLKDSLAKGKLGLKDAVEVTCSVAEALAEAHSHGVVHRDIKPSNVIIGPRGKVKVLDFGLARFEDHFTGPSDPSAKTLFATKTRSGTVIGTPAYLSPEQAKGEVVDHRSDLFSLGTLLYESITGSPPFLGNNVIEVAGHVINSHPPAPSKINPHIPAQLDRITLKALEKSPDSRYQSATELANDLGKVARLLPERKRAHVPPVASGQRLVTTLSDKLGKPRFSITTAISIAFIGVLLVVMAARLWKPKPHEPAEEAARWYAIGTDALREGAYYQASKALERAVSLDDQFALAHARLAEALTEIDYTDRARDELLKVTSLVPDRSVLPAPQAIYLRAITSTVTRNYPDAIQAYQSLAESSSSSDRPQALVDLGRAYEKNEQIRNAIDSYVKAINLDPRYATALLRVGYLYGRQQDLASATAAFDKAEQLYRETQNFEGLGEVFFQRGYLFNNVRQIPQAKSALEEAIKLASITSNPYLQIKSLLQLNWVLFRQGDTSAAHALVQEAVQLAERNEMEALTGRGLHDLGYVYFQRGQYSEAETYFNQALALAQRSRVRRNEVRAMFSLASLRVQQNRADEALDYIAQALEFYRQGGYRTEEMSTLVLLGRAHLQKGEYGQAIAAYSQQLQTAKATGDQSQLALANNEVGRVLTRQERYPQALKHFEEAFLISKSQGDEQSQSWNMMYRASALWPLGRIQEARELLQTIEERTARPGSSFGFLALGASLTKARIALSEGRVSEATRLATNAHKLAAKEFAGALPESNRTLCAAKLRAGAAGEAKTLCETAVELAVEANDPWAVAQAQLELGGVLLQLKDADGALANALKATEAFEKLSLPDSLWRSLLLAARASRLLRSQEQASNYASRSHEMLNGLKQLWDQEAFEGYLNRPDIRPLRRQLKTLTGASN